MAPVSGSRIDQFFASKKKTTTSSPSLKLGRVEKDPKVTLAGSPSAKGSLDNYLVTSQDEKSPAKSLLTACNSSTRPGPAKRNLTLEIDLSSTYESTESLSMAQGCPQVSQREKSEVLANSDEAVVGSLGKKSLDTVHVVENPELKQFASDFLSLYCSELPPTVSLPLESNVNAHKRQGSPSTLVLEDKSSKKRHFTEDAVTCSSEEHTNQLQSNDVTKSGEATTSNDSPEVIVHRDLVQAQASLRECAMSNINMTGCDTPGPLAANFGARQTPKSTRGSSIFSPGEAFWDEAIQIADGLFYRNDNPSGQVAEEMKVDDSLHKKKALNIIRDEGPGFRETKMCEVASRGNNIEMDAPLPSFGKKGKDKEDSPLPVKHFDFSLEDKYMGEDSPQHCSANNMGGLVPRDVELTECSFVNKKALKTAHTSTLCNQVHSVGGLCGVQEITPSSAFRKVDIFSQGNDSKTSNTPERDIIIFLTYSEEITPSSFMLPKDQLDISCWLPSELCSLYKKKGISKLYQWQVDCLQVDGVLEKRNLVYCASTSAGKSFVAEILMLRRVLSTGKVAILVLPYVSICAEKAEHLEALLGPLDKHVSSYYGNQGGGTLPKDTSVAVCTIEKANSLINRLLEEGRLSEIGIIVIDELHMVGDRHRGYLLELLLTKLRYGAGEGNTESSSGETSGTSSSKTDSTHGIQIVGMSATLPNVAAVADWLQAALYQTDFRPVPLEEYIKVGSTIYNKKMEIVRTIPKAADFGGKDPDHIIELCNEVVQDGHSVLIFCSSRKGCESTARHVAKYLKKFIVSTIDDQSEFPDIASAIDALKRSPAGLDPVLDETLPSGVAYHHAGLTVEEREIVESCYRKGLVRVLTATSTLAAGVNLPARRVIFRQSRIGRDFIDGTRYRQMAGRAGRTGIDSKGESVLICKPEEVKKIMALINDSCPPLHSCLSDDMNGMTHAILEVVAGGIVQTANDIHRYVRCTLLNSTKPFEDVVKSAKESLRWLCQRRFLEWSEDTKLYSTTPLGRASFGSSLCPEESLIVLDDLSRAREGFVLASDLHLVYLVTPINVDVEPDWELYYERFMQLSALDQSVGNRVGVQEPFLMRMAHGAPFRSSNKSRDNSNGLQNICDHRIGVSNHGMLSEEQMRRVCKRFYVALILSRLVQELPVGDVCEAYKVARGMVQALQENAGRFASMVSVFCERLGWHDLEGLVAKFQNRVSFGVRAEIVELTTIPHIKGSRARALYKAGLRTPQAIAEASIPEIVKALFESSSWAAQEGSAQRRMQLGVAKKIKNGARKVVLDKAEEARAAAFAAFKALGVEMPQFTRTLVPTVAGNTTMKEATTSSPEDTTSNFVGMEQGEHLSAKPGAEGSKYLGEFTSGMESVKHEASDVGGSSSDGEAMAASFSVKALGVEIPQSSRPLVPTVAGYTSMKEATTSSTQDTTRKFVNMEQIKHLSTKTGAEGSEYLGKVTSGMGIVKHKTTDVGVGSSAEANSDDTLRKSVAENPEVAVERYGTVGYGHKTTSDHINISEIAPPFQLARSNSAKVVGNKHLDPPVQEESIRGNACVVTKESSSEKGPVNAVNIPGGIDSFLDLWNTTDEFYFDLHFNKRSEFNSIAPFEIQGIAICWKDSPVYYVALPKDLFWSDRRRNGLSFENLSAENSDVAAPEYRFEIAKKRWNKFGLIMGKMDVRKFCWNLKIQFQVLKNPAVSIQRFSGPSLPVKTMGLELIENLYYMLSPIYLKNAVDMCIVAWILWPDEERSSNPNLEKEVKKRLSSEAAVAANRSGRWRNQTRRAAHNGCCRRAAQIRALSSVLWKLLTSEGLLEALVNIEMPLVNVLADMELSGIGVDMEGCLQSRHVLREKLKYLEKEAYKLAGMTFSLSMAADIANVLYVHLKLPIPEAYNKGKQHPSTDKHCLDFLRYEHPIIPVIKEHRTLSKLLKCTLGAVCALARLSMRTQKYTLHGHWLQTSTATGRLSMEEPNLQCVEHLVEFRMNHNEQNELDSGADHYKINPRDFFLPTQDNWLLLTADYSQIELRLMAHFSKDPSLIDLLMKPHGDVFNMIAAKWTSKTESSVSPQERDQTKRLVYGILYGMGPNTLAEQLDCSSDDAAEKIQSFKRSFPGVASWLQEAVTSCRQKGYVETLMKRKRFLAKIKLGNSEEKSKAQRQAVNSICQGSAADIIKIAMINIHSVIGEGVEKSLSNVSLEKFHILKGRCRILLQVHDELVLEADPSVVNEAGLLLKTSMETAALLLVPLHVKLKFGRTWGSLEPLPASEGQKVLNSEGNCHLE